MSVNKQFLNKNLVMRCAETLRNATTHMSLPVHVIRKQGKRMHSIGQWIAS